jgi:branched-chain amino acid transport system ATP-binding protein
MFEIKGLTKHFGGLVALDNLDMTVNQGEKVGLIGPNGAGKTTCFNLITGFLRPTVGEVIFEGNHITSLSPNEVAKRGIVRTFQLTSVFPNFTVLENIAAGHFLHPKTGLWEGFLHTPSSRKKEEQVLSKSLEIAKFVGLEHVKDAPAQSLPHGYKRILGIAIALAAEPKLLLLDEPLSGMHAGEVTEAMALINKISESGITILLIEHNMRGVMSLCQRIVAINFGKKIAEGTPQEIQKNEELIQAYLGVGTHAT